VTQAVIEPEPRGRSSAPETSDKEPTAANKPEIAEPHPLTAPEKTELEELRKLNQRLTSGFYPMPYFEPGKPLTPGVAAGPEVQMYVRPAARTAPITTDLVYTAHPDIRSASIPTEYSILR